MGEPPGIKNYHSGGTKFEVGKIVEILKSDNNIQPYNNIFMEITIK
jgi:hypothetical protein